MKKSQVNAFQISGYKTAEYVITHAIWQKSRGRNPSEGYGPERNPAKALNQAYAELAIYIASAGQHLAKAVFEMIAVANLTKRSCTTQFNDITITVLPGGSLEAVMENFRIKTDQQNLAYQNSPAGKAATARRLKQKRALQLQMNKAMAELPKIDLSNISNAIAWLDKIQSPSDRIGIKTPVEQIVPLFEIAGYAANENCGEKFDENDKENFGRYIIGQALSFLKEAGSIHQIFPVFAQRWRERFPA